MRRIRLRAASAGLSVLVCVLAAACSGSVAGPASAGSATSARSSAVAPATAAGAAGTGTPAATGTPGSPVTLRASWPERRIAPESVDVLSQVFDPATNVLYTLVSRTQAPANGPYVLQATDLRTGTVRQGESYSLAQLSLVSGYLWVSGWPSAGKPAVLAQIHPGTLHTVRSVAPSRISWGSAVAPGPAGSVWVGAYRTLLRISVDSGAVLARTVLPPGLGLSGLAASPGGADLYVSAAHLVGHGAMEGAVILEYSASTGGLLADTDRTPISYSVAGAELTALPGGVWVSFRTGSAGRSVLLSEQALSTVIAPVPAPMPETVYYWPMFSSSVYGAGVLWVTTLTGLVACVDPATGRVRASETVTSQAAQLGGLLVADGATRRVYGLVGNDGYNALVSISPPDSCWG
jgi:hypothetical protein